MILHFGDGEEFVKELANYRPVRPFESGRPKVVDRVVRVTCVQKPVGGGMPTWDLFLVATALVSYGDDGLHVVRFRRHCGQTWPGMENEQNRNSINFSEQQREELEGILTKLGLEVRCGVWLEPTQPGAGL